MEKLVQEYQRMKKILEEPDAHFPKLGSSEPAPQFKDDKILHGCIPACVSKVTLNAYQYDLSFKDGSMKMHAPDIALLSSWATTATFGNAKTGETLQDDHVRKGKDILLKDHLAPGTPEQQLLSLLNKNLAHYLKAFVQKNILPDAKYIQLDPYKINVYDTGDFFTAHKDSPIPSTMIGTLILILPSADLKGGIMKFSHGGETMDVRVDEDDLTIVAFTSDVLHEVTPITEGTRVSISFKFSVGTTENDHSSVWKYDDDDDDTDTEQMIVLPNNFVPSVHIEKPYGYVMDHEYTWNNLSPASLRGNDLTKYKMFKSHPDVERIEMVCVICRSQGEIGYENQTKGDFDVFLAEEQDVMRATSHQKPRMCPYGEDFVFFKHQNEIQYLKERDTISHQKTSFAEYVGNESRPGSWDCVYYSAAFLVFPKNHKKRKVEEVLFD